jgi:hypothetical protein
LPRTTSRVQPESGVNVPLPLVSRVIVGFFDSASVSPVPSPSAERAAASETDPTKASSAAPIAVVPVGGASAPGAPVVASKPR